MNVDGTRTRRRPFGREPNAFVDPNIVVRPAAHSFAHEKPVHPGVVNQEAITESRLESRDVSVRHAAYPGNLRLEATHHFIPDAGRTQRASRGFEHQRLPTKSIRKLVIGSDRQNRHRPGTGNLAEIGGEGRH